LETHSHVFVLVEGEAADPMGKISAARSNPDSIGLHSHYSNATATGLERLQRAERMDTK
jgi:hypothetical protein